MKHLKTFKENFDLDEKSEKKVEEKLDIISKMLSDNMDFDDIFFELQELKKKYGFLKGFDIGIKWADLINQFTIQYMSDLFNWYNSTDKKEPFGRVIKNTF